MSNYHCLVAGLPDIAFDGAKCQYSVERFKEEIYPSLSANDARVVDLILLERDNANLLRILRGGEEAILESEGCYNRVELMPLQRVFPCIFTLLWSITSRMRDRRTLFGKICSAYAIMSMLWSVRTGLQPIDSHSTSMSTISLSLSQQESTR